MKIAVLGNYKEGTGYSNACKEYILAMDSVGLNVVPRHIKMTNMPNQENKRISELEQNDLHNVDVVIQHNLPSEFVYKGGVLNIGSFAWETNGFPNSTWDQNIKLMDAMFVPSSFMTKVVKHKKTFVIPHALDTDKFNKEYEFCEFGANKNTVKFYTISEYNKRKNIQGLILTYLSTFDAIDNVLLIIKTNGNQKEIRDVIDDIKFGLKRFKNPDRYPKIVLITSYLDDDQISAIHKNCDIFVSASYGEGFCIPAVDALGFGNTILVPDSTSFQDFTAYKTVLFKTHPSKCFGSVDSLADVYTSDEEWYAPDILDFSNWMRNLYNCKINNDPDMNDDSFKEVVKLSYCRQTIGNIIKSTIERLLDAK